MKDGKEEDTAKLLKAAEQTLIQKGDETTGWSTGWRINLWARLHNSQQAYHLYRKLLTYVSPDNYTGPDRRSSGGTYPNLFDAHAPFQIDGNFGGTAGVCEMLIQSASQHPAPNSPCPTASTNTQPPTPNTLIELLPALPKEWPTGTVRGLKARGGHTVDISWKDGRLTEATITPVKDGTLQLIYNGTCDTYTLKAGKPMKIKK